MFAIPVMVFYFNELKLFTALLNCDLLITEGFLRLLFRPPCTPSNFIQLMSCKLIGPQQGGGGVLC